MTEYVRDTQRTLLQERADSAQEALMAARVAMVEAHDAWDASQREARARGDASPSCTDPLWRRFKAASDAWNAADAAYRRARRSLERYG